MCIKLVITVTLFLLLGVTGTSVFRCSVGAPIKHPLLPSCCHFGNHSILYYRFFGRLDDAQGLGENVRQPLVAGGCFRLRQRAC